MADRAEKAVNKSKGERKSVIKIKESYQPKRKKMVQLNIKSAQLSRTKTLQKAKTWQAVSIKPQMMTQISFLLFMRVFADIKREMLKNKCQINCWRDNKWFKLWFERRENIRDKIWSELGRKTKRRFAQWAVSYIEELHWPWFWSQWRSRNSPYSKWSPIWIPTIPKAKSKLFEIGQSPNLRRWLWWMTIWLN